MTAAQPQRLGQGFYWQDIREGQVFETFRRTVTETDLVKLLVQWEKLVSDSEHMGSYLLCLRSADGLPVGLMAVADGHGGSNGPSTGEKNPCGTGQVWC